MDDVDLGRGQKSDEPERVRQCAEYPAQIEEGSDANRALPNRPELRRKLKDYDIGGPQRTLFGNGARRSKDHQPLERTAQFPNLIE